MFFNGFQRLLTAFNGHCKAFALLCDMPHVLCVNAACAYTACSLVRSIVHTCTAVLAFCSVSL
jgi:hypothetical protein